MEPSDHARARTELADLRLAREYGLDILRGAARSSSAKENTAYRISSSTVRPIRCQTKILTQLPRIAQWH